MTNERADGRTTQPRPRVLITRAEDIPGERWEDYADRVREAGAEPIAFDLSAWQHGAPMPPFDGLLVTGGVDIDPAGYGAERSDRVAEVNPSRDAFELQLLELALERDAPVLGICRGHQLFNVAHGGSLLQHLEEREPHRARRGADGVTVESGWHHVDVAAGTRLASLLSSRRVRTNSRHHQAVTTDRVADGLAVAATTQDGVVEALEQPSKRWALSVQWHPERPENAEPFRPLFEDFVRACRTAAIEAGQTA